MVVYDTTQANATMPAKSPKTGDASYLWMSVMMIFGAAMVSFIQKIKKFF